MTSSYERLGIDPHKSSVSEIYESIIDNEFPDAFVNIARCTPGIYFTKHSDGDGSKGIQRLLHYLETDDELAFRGAVDDAFAMNFGDIAACGFTSGPIEISQTLNINAAFTPKDILMKQNALRIVELLHLYREHGISTLFLGGETADLPDQVKTMVYDVDVRAETTKNRLIRGNLQPGDKIFGFASDGKAAWEDEVNSGIMSNGLTMARTVLMHRDYSAAHPFLLRDGGEFSGSFYVTDTHPLLGDMDVSEALMSPTRQWHLLIRKLSIAFREAGCFDSLHGISMNTGGGATKILNVGKGIVYQKKMPAMPGIFQLIQKVTNEPTEHMYTSFNCGVGLDVVIADDPKAIAILQQLSQETAIELFELGLCEKNNESEKNLVLIEHDSGSYSYEK